jgi:branched-chain amino acid transport system substrate-binding protein
MSWLGRLACRLIPVAVLASGAAHAAEPFTIGLNLGQTGTLAPNGKAALLAMQI